MGGFLLNKTRIRFMSDGKFYRVEVWGHRRFLVGPYETMPGAYLGRLEIAA